MFRGELPEGIEVLKYLLDQNWWHVLSLVLYNTLSADFRIGGSGQSLQTMQNQKYCWEPVNQAGRPVYAHIYMHIHTYIDALLSICVCICVEIHIYKYINIYLMFCQYCNTSLFINLIHVYLCIIFFWPGQIGIV